MQLQATHSEEERSADNAGMFCDGGASFAGGEILLRQQRALMARWTATDTLLGTRTLGFVVERVASAREAFAKLAADGRDVDLIFSDVVMPGSINGVDLARELKRLRPELPVLLTSGILTPFASWIQTKACR